MPAKADAKAKPKETKKAAPAKKETKPKAEAKPKAAAKPKTETKTAAKPAVKPAAKPAAKPKAAPAKKQYVLPHKNTRGEQDGWSVKLEGSSKATKVFRTKAEAEAYAKELSKKQGADMVRQKKDGKFQKK